MRNRATEGGREGKKERVEVRGQKEERKGANMSNGEREKERGNGEKEQATG